MGKPDTIPPNSVANAMLSCVCGASVAFRHLDCLGWRWGGGFPSDVGSPLRLLREGREEGLCVLRRRWWPVVGAAGSSRMRLCCASSRQGGVRSEKERAGDGNAAGGAPTRAQWVTAQRWRPTMGNLIRAQFSQPGGATDPRPWWQRHRCRGGEGLPRMLVQSDMSELRWWRLSSTWPKKRRVVTMGRG